MGTYETVVTVVFSLLALALIVSAVRSFLRASGEEDDTRRKALCRNALLLSVLGLMFLLCALYILLRISRLLLAVFLIGFASFGAVLGAGLSANIRAH